MNRWLMKSEPEVYSIDDLERDGRTTWEGIRNYLARNHMREMRVGDPVLFYHSNASPPAIVGIAEVAAEATPDPFAFEPGHRYFDAKSDPEKPRWDLVEIAFRARLPRPVTLAEVKGNPRLAEMQLRTAARLSVQRVSSGEWEEILRMAGSPPTE